MVNDASILLCGLCGRQSAVGHYPNVDCSNLTGMILSFIFRELYLMAGFQTGVALKRIETYLEEDEVDEQVSSIKKDRAPYVDGEDETLSIENGFFKWNEVPEKPEESSKGKGKNHTPTSSTDETATAVDSESIRSPTEDHRFELKDITIQFPEGELSVITGPTASGKTALLVSKVLSIEIQFSHNALLDGTAGRDDHHQRQIDHFEEYVEDR